MRYTFNSKYTISVVMLVKLSHRQYIQLEKFHGNFEERSIQNQDDLIALRSCAHKHKRPRTTAFIRIYS